MIPIIATLSEWHLILALIVVFLLFGGKKLPELARGIGEAIKEFKKSQRDPVAVDNHQPAPVRPETGTPAATTTVTSTSTTSTPVQDKPVQKSVDNP